MTWWGCPMTSHDRPVPDLVPQLSRGKHRNPRKGACFMELASYLAGERWSDHPLCTHPLLATMARLVNDHTTDSGRDRLGRLVPSVIGLTSEDPQVDVELEPGVVAFVGPNGQGKTTLCAALAHRGWRLLSDEFGIVRIGTTNLVPFPRPMPLKNESIDILRAFAPNAFFGPRIEATAKGDIVHLRAPSDSVERADETARVAWIVFPRWTAGAPLSLEPVGANQAFLALATNAFNYELIGEPAFETVKEIVATSRRMRLQYSALDDAVEALNALCAQTDA